MQSLQMISIYQEDNPKNCEGALDIPLYNSQAVTYINYRSL